jgi:hypothetical protein
MSTLKEYIADGLRKGYSRKELEAALIQKGYSKKDIDAVFDRPVEAKSKIPNAELGFFERLPYIIAHPKLFFQNVRDRGIGKSLGLLTFSIAIMAVLSFFIGMFFSMILRTGWFLGGYGAGYGIGIGIFSLIGIFIYSGLTHAFVKMFRGTGSYVDTFNALAYSSAPSMLVSWIPFIGGICGIYSIFLSVFGLSEYHELSKGKAFGAWFFAALVLMILIGILIFAFISIAFRNW